MQVGHEDLEAAFWRILEDGEEPLQIVSSSPGGIASSTLPRLSQVTLGPDQERVVMSLQKRRKRARFSAPLPQSAGRPALHHRSSPSGAPQAAAAAADAHGARQQLDGRHATAGASAASWAASGAAADAGISNGPLQDPTGPERGAASVAHAPAAANAAEEARADHTIGEKGSGQLSAEESEDEMEVEVDRAPSGMQLESDGSSSDGDEDVFQIARAPPWRLDQIPRLAGSLLRWLHPQHDMPGLACAQASFPAASLDAHAQQYDMPCIMLTCCMHSQQQIVKGTRHVMRLSVVDAAGHAIRSEQKSSCGFGSTIELHVSFLIPDPVQ